MYSLTFCVRLLMPERHQWKPAVQTAAVMLRTPPVGGRSAAPASRMRRAVLGAPPVTRRSPAGGARRLRPDGRSHYVVISRFALCCHSNATRAPIANPPNNAQLGGSLYHAPSYIRVRAVVWAYGRGQPDRQTDTDRHTDARDHNTFCVVYDSRKMLTETDNRQHGACNL